MRKLYDSLAKRLGALVDDGMCVLRSDCTDEFYATFRRKRGLLHYLFFRPVQETELPELEADMRHVLDTLDEFDKRWGAA